MLGDFAARESVLDKALSNCRRFLKVNSGQLKTRKKMVILLRKMDMEEYSREREKLKNISANYGKPVKTHYPWADTGKGAPVGGTSRNP